MAMASNFSRLMTGSREAGHGTLRGADAAQSPQFEGNFGRMFRTLRAASFDKNDLQTLALGFGADENRKEGMTADPEVALDANGNKRRDKNGFLIPSLVAIR